MVPTEYASLNYFRRFAESFASCCVVDLFVSSNRKQGYFPLEKVQFAWSHPCEFVSTAYREPLECVHARRMAFGTLGACIESEIRMPERSLLFSTTNQRMTSYGHVSIHWKLSGVLEVPRFIVSSATSDQLRVQLGFGERSIEMLKAAATLKPAEFDVFGFCTPDQRLIGAAEFTGQRQDDLYEAHLFTVDNGRELMVGDELWGYSACTLGAAKVEARCLLAVVEQIPGLPVPPLERPNFR